MTWNIHGNAALYGRSHIARIAQVIGTHEPDVVALQEVHRGTWRSRYQDQAEELRERTGMALSFGPSFARGEGSYGNAILTRGRVLHAQTHPLPGSGEPRSLLETLIETNGGVLTAFVTHFAAGGRLGRAARLRQAGRVARITRRSRIPYVLAGDFNSTPSSRELSLLAKGERVVSCLAASSATHRLTRQCLDYIFVDRRWEIEDARVVDEGPSDHWPILAELRWSSAPEDVREVVDESESETI